MALYEKYGFPKEFEIYVIPIQKFLEANPDAKYLTEDPEYIKDKVKGYEAILPINISLDYVKKRKLNKMKAFRELVQNALDETEAIKGQPDVEIKQENSIIWIIDYGRGLNGSAFIIGTSEKECWMRGYYGEGLKLAAGYFLSKGKRLYIFSKKLVFKPVLYPKNAENPNLYILLGESNVEGEGTRIAITDLELEADISEIVSFKNPELEGKEIDTVYVKGENCEVERPYVIYDVPNKLYVRNLFVGKMDEVAKRPSFFSYDVWWFRLDVSRELLTYSMPQMFLEVGKIYDNSEKARRKLARKLIESKMVRVRNDYGGKIIEFSPIFGIFEGHLFVYTFPKGILENIIEELELVEKKDCIRLFTEENEREEIEEAVKNGIIPFMVSSELADKSKLPKYAKGETCK
ncbi:MAG: hypothetical protein ACP6IP_02320 [Candidatus Njordarchaeia archaeon]